MNGQITLQLRPFGSLQIVLIVASYIAISNAIPVADPYAEAAPGPDPEPVAVPEAATDVPASGEQPKPLVESGEKDNGKDGDLATANTFGFHVHAFPYAYAASPWHYGFYDYGVPVVAHGHHHHHVVAKTILI